jgi:predicted outer membrane repeat protein
MTSTSALAQVTKFFVDDNGSDGNTGADWTHAFRTLQKGLDSADGVDDIVLVAHGTYGPSQIGSSGAIDLVDGVPAHGGFVGGPWGGTSENYPDGSFLQTHISGALSSSDSEPVVLALTVSNATLDGFVIENGNQIDGAGLYCTDPYQVHIENITFRNNIATEEGGAIYLKDGWDNGLDPDVDIFGFEIDRCTLHDNNAVHGAAFFMALPADKLYTAALVSNAVFYDNGDDETTTAGGAIYCSPMSYLVVANSLIHNNYADDGGGLYVAPMTTGNTGNKVIIGNSTISRNTSGSLSSGAGIHVGPSGTNNNVLRVLNSITYGNLFAYDLYRVSGSHQFTLWYSDYGTNSGATISTGCISSDPLFVNAAAADFHLKTSPALSIDYAYDFDVLPDIADIDENNDYGEDLPWDLDLAARVVNYPATGVSDYVDMGCYEKPAQ